MVTEARAAMPGGWRLWLWPWGVPVRRSMLTRMATAIGSSDPDFPTRIDCSKPAGYAEFGRLRRLRRTSHPGGTELCDGKDNNCDGRKDESVVYQPYCEDKDGDGHGVAGRATKSDCKPSAGYGDCKGDCNDNDATTHPGAPEVCDGGTTTAMASSTKGCA